MSFILVCFAFSTCLLYKCLTNMLGRFISLAFHLRCFWIRMWKREEEKSTLQVNREKKTWFHNAD